MKTNFISFLTASVWAFSAFGQPSADQSLDRTFNLNETGALQNLQEIATLVRGITGIKQVAIDSEQKLLAVHGAADQIALTEWLVKNLELHPNLANPVKRKYQMATSEDRDNVVSVFYVPHTETVQNLQEVATVVRSIGEIRRLFTYHAPRAIVVRGTAEQIDLAEWLVHELDQPANAATSVTREYMVPGPGDPDNVVRVFSLKHAATQQRLQEIAVQVRTMTQVRRLFTYNAPRIIALRGTPGQVEQANQMIGERDR
jgi:hypothetical protein